MNTQELILTPWEGVDLNNLFISTEQKDNGITILIVDRNGNHYFELSAEKMSITDEDDNTCKFGLFIKTFKDYPQLLNEEIYKAALENFMNYAKWGMCITNDGYLAYYQYLWAKLGQNEDPVIARILGLCPTPTNQNEKDIIIYMKEIIRPKTK